MPVPDNRTRALSLTACFGLAVAGCAEEARAPIAPPETDDDARMCADEATTVEVFEEQRPDVDCPDVERTLLCYGSWAAHCAPDGTLVDLVNCREDDQVCAPHKCDDEDDCTGCRDCVPGSVRCGDDGELMRCDGDGSGYEVAQVCDEDAGEYCSLESGACEDLCEVAEESRSYIGCEYLAVPTLNRLLEFDRVDEEGLCEPFTYAVVVSNPQGVDAEITIDNPRGEAMRYSVAAGKTRTIPLSCVPELKGDSRDEPASTLVAGAAHHIRSNVPVTLYQFNPLEFQSGAGSGGTYSFTNDASLLLPTHSMTGNYVVMSSPTLATFIDLRPGIDAEDLEGFETDDAIPGFAAIVGVDEEPTAVTITSSAHTRASSDGLVPALRPGDRLELTLRRGEVLQLVTKAPEECDGEAEQNTPLGPLTYCSVGQDYDLTGTRVQAEGRVGVVSGHDCTFLPRNRWACDHLEESMLPVESWGREIWVSVSEGIACQPDVPNMVRVLSDSDGNRINFVPEVHEPVVLDAGDYLQFEYDEDFRVTASGAVMVAQYLLGQDYAGFGSAGDRGIGDPALSLGIPLEQWRDSYAFVAPETFPLNYVNVIAREGQLILFDGLVVSGLQTIEGTKMAVARLAIEGGEHRMESAHSFGIVLYGYAPYTSYMLPGGLDLTLINGPE